MRNLDDDDDDDTYTVSNMRQKYFKVILLTLMSQNFTSWNGDCGSTSAT